MVEKGAPSRELDSQPMTATKIATCLRLDPFLVTRIGFLEWTPEERLRHPRFAGIRSDKDARDVTRLSALEGREYLGRAEPCRNSECFALYARLYHELAINH